MPNTSLAKELSVALSVLPGLSILATICAINYIANDNMRSGAIIFDHRARPVTGDHREQEKETAVG